MIFKSKLIVFLAAMVIGLSGCATLKGLISDPPPPAVQPTTEEVCRPITTVKDGVPITRIECQTSVSNFVVTSSVVKTETILISGEFTGILERSIKKQLHRLPKDSVVKIQINSRGGYVHVGESLSRLIKALPNRTVVCVNVGNAQSAAATLFVNCPALEAYKGSIVMFHQQYYMVSDFLKRNNVSDDDRRLLRELIGDAHGLNFNSFNKILKADPGFSAKFRSTLYLHRLHLKNALDQELKSHLNALLTPKELKKFLAGENVYIDGQEMVKRVKDHRSK
jgi:ATP-dependent protease ClpP protease subunit